MGVILAGSFLPNPLSAKKMLFLASPRYKIDIALSLTGRCAGINDSPTFSNFRFSTSFGPVKFDKPVAEGYDCWFYIEDKSWSNGLMPTTQLQGEGSILDFQICPMWEDIDKSIPATAIKGPNSFNPIIDLLSKSDMYDDTSTAPIIALAGFRFCSNFSNSGDVLSWKYDGEPSSVNDDDFWFFCNVPLQELSAGKAFFLDTTIQYDLNQGKWSVIFTPLSEEK